MVWDLIRMAQMSVANTTIFPIQDILNLGSEARFNLPGTSNGNWQWQLPQSLLKPTLAQRLKNGPGAATDIENRRPRWNPQSPMDQVEDDPASCHEPPVTFLHLEKLPV